MTYNIELGLSSNFLLMSRNFKQISNLLQNESDLNKEKSKKEIFLDAAQLDYRTVTIPS